MRAQLIVLLLVAVGVANAAWSAWTPTPNSECSDTCGYCGVRVFATRVCTPTGTCSGPAQQYEECGAKMCKFGSKNKRTCCEGYKKGLVQGTQGWVFECVAKADIKAKKRLN